MSGSNLQVRPSRRLVEAVVAAMTRVLQLSGPADRMLSSFFLEHRWLGQSERGIVANAVFEVLRRKLWLEHIAGTSAPRELALCALVTAGEIDRWELEATLKERERIWLRGINLSYDQLKAERHSLELALNLPPWVVRRLRHEIPDETALRHLGESLLETAPLDLRVNLHRMGRDEACDRLRETGLIAHPTPHSPSGVRIDGKPPINRHPLFLEGAIEVQDEGSQLLAYLTAPRRGEMVVDFCAGAGGKTLALAALMKSAGRVYAFDISDRRLANLRPRLARSGLSNVHPQRIESERDPRVRRLDGKIDRVLVDAPCSGFGTLRRNPDLKWRFVESAISELTAKQACILASAARLVKPGGRLVYATCSLLGEENDAIVEAFAREHSEFSLLDANVALGQQGIRLPESEPGYLRLWPHIHGTDGFFAAVLERRPRT